jgi:hypothetical protein
MLVLALSMDSSSGTQEGMIFEIKKGGNTGIDFQDNVASVPAGAPVGSASGHVFFAPEADASVTSVTALCDDLYPVDKHWRGAVFCGRFPVRGRLEISQRRCGEKLLLQGQNADFLFFLALSHEADNTVNSCEQGVIATHSHVLPGGKNSPALTNQYIAGPNLLTTESLHTEPLCITIASVPRTPTGFFVCQRVSPPSSTL